MKRKVIALITAGVLALGLIGCGKETKDTGLNNAETEQSVSIEKAPKEERMKKRNGKSWARGTVFAWLLIIILLEITIGTTDIRREQALEAQEAEAEVLIEKTVIEPAIPMDNEEAESKTSVTLTNEDFVDGVAEVSFGITLTIDD